MNSYEYYKQAGRLAREALELGIGSIKEGVSYQKIAEIIESFIHENGKIAFPVNISVNSVAAHYTPSLNDTHVFKRGDVVKVDVGAHVNGYIGDTAKTIEVGQAKSNEMIRAAEEALDEVIATIKDGTRISEIGEIIENNIRSFGFLPIKNLQGHSLERYNLHAGISIPNIANNNKKKLRVGDVIAVEPFATDGGGRVVDQAYGNIYHLSKKTGKFVKELYTHFHNLPFAERWLVKIVKEDEVHKTISFLLKRKSIFAYKSLAEINGGVVTQAEHTLMVTKNGCEVLTISP